MGGAISEKMVDKSKVPFVSMPFDLVCFGGVSIVGFLLYFASMQSGGSWIKESYALEITAMLSWVINWPHFSATLWRLYGSKSSMKEFPLTAGISPLFVLIGTVASFLNPEFFAGLWVKFFFLWSGYHFSAQSLGISLLYLRRNNVNLNFIDQKIFSLFTFTPYLLSTLAGETTSSHQPYFGVTVPVLHLPDWISTYSKIGMWVVVAIFALRYFQIRRRLGQWPHLLVLVPLLTQFVWFWLAADHPIYNAFVPAFHSFQYLALAWYMDAFAQKDSSTKKLTHRGLIWFAVNVFGGAFLFYFLPRIVESILPSANAISGEWVEGVVIASVQIHHFFVDGVIWKMRSDSIRLPLGTKWQRAAVFALLFFFGTHSIKAQAQIQSLIFPEMHMNQELAAERVILRTDFGDLQLAFYEKVAPVHKKRILEAVRNGAFDNIDFPRLHRDFVLQISEVPGEVGPNDPYPAIKAEISDLPHVRGVLSMARGDESIDTARTSFSILLGDAPHLDKQYTVFGRLEAGEEVLKKIEELAPSVGDQPRIPIVVRRAEVFKLPDEHGLVELRGPMEPAEMSFLRSPSGSIGVLRWVFLFAFLLFCSANFMAYVVRQPSLKLLRWSRYLHGFSILSLSFGMLGLGISGSQEFADHIFSFCGLLGMWLSFRALSGLENPIERQRL